ncbi:MAG: polysaccharide deacetylase family protein [Oscillospiraceae bacterium]|jgi:peptidoglycan/xylan/chitin deacetylase (PgdA/CDA1 family)|nr:polysaccharide deacetylase family protein [Oscillospiraceae bacterium]
MSKTKKALTALLLVAALLLPMLGLRALEPVRATAAREGVELPILMYHQLTKDARLVNEFTVTVDQFAKDLDALAARGYTAVRMEQVLAYVEQGKPLPEKPVIISFDDGLETFSVYAAPLLKAKGWVGVFAVIGSETDKFSAVDDHHLKYSSCTWAQLKELSDAGTGEIVSHTWDLHKNKNGRKGAAKIAGESEAAYRSVLAQDDESQRAAFAHAGLPAPTVYVYPYGEYSAASPKILQELGYRAAFICDARMNTLRPGDTDALMALKRYIRKPNCPLPI